MEAAELRTIVVAILTAADQIATQIARAGNPYTEYGSDATALERADAIIDQCRRD